MEEERKGKAMEDDTESIVDDDSEYDDNIR